MLQWGLAGFLAGFLAMWNVELQLLWLCIVCLPALIAEYRKTGGLGLKREPVAWLAGAFLTWNLAIGLLRNPEALRQYYTLEFLVGSLALPFYLGMVWLVCRRAGTMRLLFSAIVWSAVLAAVSGIFWWYFVQCPEEPGARLRNPLVYGGLHPVPTAILLSFGLLCAALLWRNASQIGARRWQLVATGVISLALMLTISRGGMLAALCGLAVLPFAGGWRKFWPPALSIAAGVAVFQLFATLLAPFDFKQAAAHDGDPAAVVVNLSVLTDSPNKELVARADSGRLKIYHFGISLLDSWDKKLTGAGLWGPELEVEKIAGQWGINHFHSLPVATFIHSGIVGLLLMGSIVLLSLRRAWLLARERQPEWIVLLACGLGGLIFDSQSACSLVTHSRFENLTLWFPVLATAAAWRNRGEIQAGRQLSRSESR